MRCGSRLLIARGLGIACGVRSWSWASGGRGRNAQGRRRVSVSRKGGGLRELRRLRAYGRGLPVHTGVRGAVHREWEAPEHARSVLPAEAQCILGTLTAPCAQGVRGAGAHAAALGLKLRRRSGGVRAARSLACVELSPDLVSTSHPPPTPVARPPLRSPVPDFFQLGGRDQSDRFVSLKYWGPHGAGGRERDVVQVGRGDVWWELEAGTFTWDSPKPLEPTPARAHVDSPGPEWNFPAGSLAIRGGVEEGPPAWSPIGKEGPTPLCRPSPPFNCSETEFFPDARANTPAADARGRAHFRIQRKTFKKLASFLYSRIFSPAKALVG